MSDSGRDETGFEDSLILDLLDFKDEHREPSSGTTGMGPPVERLRREYLEVLGLLPYELEPLAPSPVARQRILEAIGESSIGSVGQRADIVTSMPKGLAGSGLSGKKWFLPIAASVAFVMIAVTGWLVLQVRGQQAQIAELSSQLDQARSSVTELATSRGMLAEMRSRLELVTAPGAQFCALRPPAGSQAAGAIGMVVMHPVKEEWFLRIEGLEPCSKGRKYVVWFETGDGAQPGPVFGVKQPGDTIELTVRGRPPRIDAIMITLESDPAPTTPSMEPLLFGDERMQLL